MLRHPCPAQTRAPRGPSRRADEALVRDTHLRQPKTLGAVEQKRLRGNSLFRGGGLCYSVRRDHGLRSAMTKDGQPPIHPGEILRDELDTLGLSANALAKTLQVPTNRVTAILNGERGITASTALRLARFFATSPEFWLNLQAQYDLKLARKQ